MTPWKIAFVAPRYGEHILGGAETLARGFAEQLAAVGLAETEIFTTCATSHMTWKNDLPAGTTLLNGVKVHRFPIDHDRRNVGLYTELHTRLIQDDALSIDEQLEWIHQSAHSPQLYQALERQAKNFDFVFFVPYLFGTTFYGSAVCPDRAIVWPCLHDEYYAYMEIVRDLFGHNLGVMFNSTPEMKLAERLYGRQPGWHAVGFGMDPLPAQISAERFRQRHNLHEPFMLYSGRLELPKNVGLLLDYFIQYKQENPGPLKLVLMGTGPVPVPTHPDIVGVGFQQGMDKLDGYAAASILCQPSTNESFSIVIMESWMSGVPVLVHGQCDVTRHHAVHSNGGLYFSNYEEFSETVSLMTNDENTRRALGQNGKRYVETQYNWSAVLNRFEAALNDWQRIQRASASVTLEALPHPALPLAS